MTFQHEDNGKNGRFFYVDDRGTESEIEYVYAGPKKIIISHTGVSDNMRNKHLGKQLVDAVVAYARDHQIKIIPLCPFAKAVMTKDDRYKDVLV